MPLAQSRDAGRRCSACAGDGAEQHWPRWRNGRRRGLKILRPHGHAGSSPALGTTKYVIKSKAYFRTPDSDQSRPDSEWPDCAAFVQATFPGSVYNFLLAKKESPDSPQSQAATTIKKRRSRRACDCAITLRANRWRASMVPIRRIRKLTGIMDFRYQDFRRTARSNWSAIESMIGLARCCSTTSSARHRGVVQLANTEARNHRLANPSPSAWRSAAPPARAQPARASTRWTSRESRPADRREF